MGNSYQGTISLQYSADTSDASIAALYCNRWKYFYQRKADNPYNGIRPAEFQFNATTGAAITDAMQAMTITITDNDGTNNIANIGVNNGGNSSTLTLDASSLTMYADDTDINCSPWSWNE